MDRRAITSAVIFLVVAAIVLVVLQYILHVQGAILKVALGIIIGAIVAGVAYTVVLKPTASA
jgi:hypothetical protein